jgi:L-ascorbate metabolism protein UlaG (beta-lactamase superfamily)
LVQLIGTVPILGLSCSPLPIEQGAERFEGGPRLNARIQPREEAAEAARRIQPRVAVPLHWGSHIGTADDARAFAEKAPVEVRVLERASV